MPEAAALRFGAEATEAAMRALRETCCRGPPRPDACFTFSTKPRRPDCESNCLGPLATWAYTIKHSVNYPVLHKLREMWPGIPFGDDWTLVRCQTLISALSRLCISQISACLPALPPTFIPISSPGVAGENSSNTGPIASIRSGAVIARRCL